LKSALAQQIAATMHFTGGSIDATVDRAGHLVTENGVIDASIDFATVDPSFAGTRLLMRETFSAQFYDYGAAIKVSRPAT
jgi:hypothetical protein